MRTDTEQTGPMDFDRNPAIVENYDQGPRWFMPGYDASHLIATVLLADRRPDGLGDRSPLRLEVPVCSRRTGPIFPCWSAGSGSPGPP